MTYPLPIARHLEPDAGPDHGDECATDPCDECVEIERDMADETRADARRDDDL